MSQDNLFYIGQLVEHKLFGYRGVILEADANFSMTDEWYQSMAKSMPPKDRPWYRILVHNANYTTYVAQQNLLIDDSCEQINHPELGKYFGYFIEGAYREKRKLNQNYR